MSRLARHVKRVGRLRLHPPRKFHRREPGLECRVVRPRCQVPPIELGDEVELPPLRIAVECRMADVLNQIGRIALLRVDIRPLERTRQKGTSPVLRLLDRVATGTHRYEPRKVLVFTAQRVRHPRAGGRPDEPRVAAVHEHQRGFVVGHVGVHRSHDEQAVGMPGHRRKQLAHLQAALAVPRKPEGGRQGRARAPLRRQVCGNLPACIGGERGLRIERVDVARAAVGEDVDHRPRPRWKVGRPRREGQARPRGVRPFGGEQARRTEPAES